MMESLSLNNKEKKACPSFNTPQGCINGKQCPDKHPSVHCEFLPFDITYCPNGVACEKSHHYLIQDPIGNPNRQANRKALCPRFYHSNIINLCKYHGDEDRFRIVDSDGFEGCLLGDECKNYHPVVTHRSLASQMCPFFWRDGMAGQCPAGLSCPMYHSENLSAPELDQNGHDKLADDGNETDRD
jgi:hypothetical protein